ncbi:hypothetical protein HOLleu_28656 [Holothuria leucospilota]|uniref:Secreted protein n=1 Tax=Holothuria leucospilota TaxID=206669 RepID=A0A9Q1H0M8_HOLLE|nr:hypothetical protein HOLleu_28656 [Holothuria leucospilota]
MCFTFVMLRGRILLFLVNVKGYLRLPELRIEKLLITMSQGFNHRGGRGHAVTCRTALNLTQNGLWNSRTQSKKFLHDVQYTYLASLPFCGEESY